MGVARTRAINSWHLTTSFHVPSWQRDVNGAPSNAHSTDLCAMPMPVVIAGSQIRRAAREGGIYLGVTT